MTNKIILTALCAILLSGGCTKGVREPDDGDGAVPLTLRASLEVPGSRATGDILDGAVFLPVGESVGVFVLDYAPGESPIWPLSLSEVQGTLGAAVDGKQPIGFASPLYYKPGRLHDIFAYYPYGAGTLSYTASNEPVRTVALTSSNQIDMITAVPVTGITSVDPDDPTAKRGVVNLEFRHRLSLMRFFVRKDAAITDTITLSKIVLNADRSQTVAVNIATGAVAKVDGGATGFEYTHTGYAIPAGELSAPLDPSAALCKFLFCPGSALNTITLTIDGQDYTTPADWTAINVPASGGALNAVITIHPVGITFTMVSSSWIDGGDPIYITNPSQKTGFSVTDAGWNTGSKVTVTPNS